MSEVVNFDERIEYKGYWWLPNHPSRQVAGVLNYYPNEKIVLELIGTFDSEKVAVVALLSKKTENIIHGLTSNAEKITLINCISSGSANFSCDFPIIRYSCQFIVVGKYLEDFECKCFYKARVIIPELSSWCHPALLKTTLYDDPDNGMRKILISFEIEDKIINNTDIDDKTSLIVGAGVNYEGKLFSPKIEQYAYIEILKQDDASIQDFYKNIYRFEQFLSLATLQTVKCSKILLYDKSLFRKYDKEDFFYIPIQLIYVQKNLNEFSANNRSDFLFDYESISEQYPQIIRKWYTEKEEIAPIRGHLIESIKSKKSFSSIDFLIIIQAIEGFCTRFRKESSLSEMLEAIIVEFSNIDKLKDDDIIVKQVVASRNYFSHFMKKKKYDMLDGLDLYNLTFKLRKILICCVLNFVGFDYSQINHIFNKCNNGLLNK